MWEEKRKGTSNLESHLTKTARVQLFISYNPSIPYPGIYSRGAGWGCMWMSVFTKKYARRFIATLLLMTKTGNSLSVSSTMSKYITAYLIRRILSTTMRVDKVQHAIMLVNLTKSNRK